MVYFVSIMILCVLLILMDTLQCDKKIKQLFYGVAVTTFVLLATLRTTTFPDTLAYIDFYKTQIGVSLIAPKGTQFEWGTVILTRLCTMITIDYRLLFFVQALIVNLIAVACLKKSNCKLLLYACFMAFYGIYTTFIIMRAGLAIAFFVLGVIRFDKNWLLRLLCFAVSMLFHISAIAMIAVWLFAYLLKKINIRAEYACLVFIVFLIFFATGTSKAFMEMLRSFFSSLSSRNLFISKAIGYLTYNIDSYEFGLSFRYLLNALVYLLTLFIIKKYKIKLSATMRANLVYVFLGLCLESLLGNTMLIGRLTDFCNVLNIGSIGIIVSNNINMQQRYQANGQASANIGKVKSLQWFSLILAIIFVCMNMVFMFRIVYR